MGVLASSSVVSDVASSPAASASAPVAELAASAIGSACGSSEVILDWGRSEGERQVGDVGVTYALSTHADVHDVIALVSIFGITAGLLFDFFALFFLSLSRSNSRSRSRADASTPVSSRSSTAAISSLATPVVLPFYAVSNTATTSSSMKVPSVAVTVTTAALALLSRSVSVGLSKVGVCVGVNFLS